MTAEVPDAAAVSPALLSRSRAVVPRAAGLVTGGFAAWAYYDNRLRPLAHAFELWIAMLALISAGQRPRRAILHACAALAAAVIAFFVGKQVMYGLDYPGMPYSMNVSEVTEWLVSAVVAGALLGWAFSWAGRPGRSGAVGTAAVVGRLHHPFRAGRLPPGLSTGPARAAPRHRELVTSGHPLPIRATRPGGRPSHSNPPLLPYSPPAEFGAPALSR